MPQRNDIDLTGFYRFDLKTIMLLLMFAGSWYTLSNGVAALNARLDLQEKSRQEVKAAEAEAEQARRQQDASERASLQAALNEMKAQVKLMSMDMGDLKVALAVKTNGGK